MSDKIVLPLLATRSVVVFPKLDSSFNVGRSKSINAINEAHLKHDGKIIIVSQIDSVQDEVKSEKDIFQYGTISTISIEQRFEKGEVKVKATGFERFKIDEIEVQNDIILASGKIIEDMKGDDHTEKALVRVISSQINSMLTNSNIPKERFSEIESVSASQLADIFGNYMPIAAEKKVQILGEQDINKRLELISKIIKDEKEIVQIEKNIDKDVRQTLDVQQREFLLREKLKAIKQQLGETSSKDNEIDDIKKRLQEGKYPKRIVEVIEKEIHKYEAMPSISAESHVSKNYIDTLLDVPWWQKSEESKSLKKAMKILDDEHYGLKEVKERIIEFLAVNSASKSTNTPVITFVGPPGVGKTSLAKSIANATNRKFVKVSLGGLRDESEIRGHRRTYIGAMPGKIILAMKKAGVINPVILLDEIDKMSSDFRGDPTSAMLEVLDPEQNKNFQDHYLEEEYDLSNVMFIATANSFDNIPRPLYDRVETIQLSSYTESEKVEIAKKHLVAKVAEETGLLPEFFDLSDEMLRFIIRYHTLESGVRSLKRELSKLARKILVLQLNKKLKKDFKIDESAIRKFLGVNKFDFEDIDKEPQIGAVRGLAYTGYGGSTLAIEVTTFKGKGELKLTGSLKDVMQESAKIALGYIKANAEMFKIDLDALEKMDIHIHVPEGATPKDGPSAGVTFTTALLSALLKVPISQKVGMTGEITLRGQILAIGGLKEKSLAATRVGLKTIFIPEKNKRQIEELPKEITSKLQIIPVSTYDEIFKQLFDKKLFHNIHEKRTSQQPVA